LKSVCDNSISRQFRWWKNGFKPLVRPEEIPTDGLYVSGF
jgi:hypothetical protein